MWSLDVDKKMQLPSLIFLPFLVITLIRQASGFFMVPPPPAFDDDDDVSHISPSLVLPPPPPSSLPLPPSQLPCLPLPVDISAINVPIEDVLQSPLKMEPPSLLSTTGMPVGGAPLHSTLLTSKEATAEQLMKDEDQHRRPRALVVVADSQKDKTDGALYESTTDETDDTDDDQSLLVTSFTPSPTALSTSIPPLVVAHAATDPTSAASAALALPSPPRLHPFSADAFTSKEFAFDHSAMIQPPTPFRSFSAVTPPHKIIAASSSSSNPHAGASPELSARLGPEISNPSPKSSVAPTSLNLSHATPTSSSKSSATPTSPKNSATPTSPRIPHVPPSRGLLARRPVLMSRRSRSLPTLVGIDQFCSGWTWLGTVLL